MADDTKELLIKISATTELLRSQLSSAERSVASFEARTNRSLANVDRRFASLNKAFGLGKVALAGFVGGLTSGLVGQLGQIPSAFGAAVQSGLDFAGSLGEQAQALGVSTKLLQEFRYAVEQNGGTFEDADNALGKFSITLGKAFDGGKQATAAFAKLGIDIKQLQAASDSERFEMVADAIARIKDPAQQASAAVAIFGKGARAIIPTLQAGADGFRRQAEEARQLGLILSDSAIQNADKVADKIQALNRALEAKIASAVAENAEAIGNLTNKLVELSTTGVDALNRFVNARRIANLGDGGQASAGAANSLLATRSGRNQLYDDIRRRQRQNVVDRGLLRVTDPEERARNQQNLERQRQAVIRAEVAARRIEAAEAAAAGNRPQPPTGLVTPTGGSGGKGGSRLSPVKADAESLIPTLQQVRDLLNDIDIDPTTVTQSRVSQAFGSGDETRSILEAIDQRRDAEFDVNREIVEHESELRADAIRTTSSLYYDLFEGGTSRVWGNFKRLGLRAIADVLGQLTAGGGLRGGNGAGNIFQSFLGSIFQGFGGFYAAGGTPPIGRPSVVGERGPELFIPNVSGTIVPNHALGGSIVNNHNYDLRGALVDKDVYADMQRIAARTVAQAAPTIINAAQLKTVDAIQRPRL